MANLGDFGSIIHEAIGDMPGKLGSATDGLKSFFGGFHDLVRRT
jgi:hypothetical protein